MSNRNAMQYTGRFSMILYDMNNEYADLYRIQEQDTRTLNEPLTSVNEGLVYSQANIVFHINNRFN